MTRARESLIDLDSTPYYHCINRCVRRAFLNGDDPYTGKNFDHRRLWLVDRIKLLSEIFAIDIAAYSIMSNHYHLVLKVDRQRVLNWSDDEVINRWQQLYNGNILVNRYLAGETLDKGCLFAIKEIVNKWRARLFDISWFMKSLNETISRKANKEDNCTGKFWEGRFKSQALLDEKSILSCMMYVDLNPIRAKMAKTLELSDFTSIQERIKQYRSHKNSLKSKHKKQDFKVTEQPNKLLKFGSNQDEQTIPFSLLDYLELADWSGRHIDPNKNGHISVDVPRILNELDIEKETWLESIKNFRRQYANFAGSRTVLLACAHQHHRSWYKGAS